MQWALDRFGELVAATDSLVYSAPLTCPACHEPVFYRRGTERKSHFVHYSLEYDSECENYFPGAGRESQSVTTAEDNRTYKFIGRGASRREASGSVAARLCIDAAESRYSSLMLRLPSSWAKSNAQSIAIKSRDGFERILSKDPAQRRFLRMPWSVPVGTCEVVGDDTSLKVEIDEALDAFRHHGNYFSSLNGRGVLIDPSDELELGRSYWLITQRVPVLRHLPRSVVIEQRESPSVGWHKYHVQIDDSSQSSSDMALIESILGRKVRSLRRIPRIVEPLPDRFGADGAYVYGSESEWFDIEWLGQESLSVVKDGEIIQEMPTSKAGIHRFEVCGEGDYAVRLNGSLALLIRVERIEPFRPRGIRMEVGNESFELFELDRIAAAFESGGSIRLRTPTQRVGRVCRLDGFQPKPIPDDISWSPPIGWRQLDGGSFGAVPIERLQRHNEHVESTFLDESKRRIDSQIQSLVVRYAGPIATREISSFRSGDDVRRWANKYGLQSILPYVLQAIAKGYTT
jgi:hypothetical protein